jgi:hypothetical protein
MLFEKISLAKYFLIIGLIICLPLAVGCSRGTKSYKPATDVGKSALETALSHWKSGAKFEPITTSKPAINVFDARWQSGKKLESYEILGEVPGQEHTQFEVRLKLAGQPEEKTVYRVIGIDPLNIFRDADYQKATGM